MNAKVVGTKVNLVTSMGDIILQLDDENAPATVENFLNYVKSDHYQDTIFHRVIDGFMIQGGGFDAEMNQKPTQAPLANEANNGLKNNSGTIAMARTADPHSATAQFFINIADNAFLDFSAETEQGWGYAVFGKVIEGMDVIADIKTVATGSFGMHKDVPLEPIFIEETIIVNDDED